MSKPAEAHRRTFSVAGRPAVVIAALLFATGGTAIKHADVAAPALAGLRSVVAACVFLAIATVRRRRNPQVFRLRMFPGGATVAVALSYAATMVLFVIANKSTTAANTIFLQSTAPLYVLLASPLLLKERARASDLAYAGVLGVGMSMFFVGVEAPMHTAPNPALGDWIAAASGLTWAGTIMGLRRLRIGNEPVLPALFWGNSVAFLACLPWICAMARPSLGDVGIVVYLGVFQVAAAYLALSAGVGAISALEASLLLLLEPVCSAILAALVHGEIPGVWAFSGCVLILSATAGRALSTAIREP